MDESLNNPITSPVQSSLFTTTVPPPSTEDNGYPAWQLMGEYTGPVESILPREFRQRLHKHFARIEREFEREYRRLYSENLALQERLDKFEDGDHSEAVNLVKKLGASMLTQRIKQQYKQSTSRLVSSLRQSTGHANPFVAQPNLNVSTSLPITNAANYPSSVNTVPSSPVVLAGTFPSHAGSWQLLNQVTAHRDGIWEVTPFRKFVATASADNTARLWVNDAQMNCLLVYLGHCGSVNSVRFRNTDNLMLTSSGDGTAHIIRLPFDLLMKVATSSHTSGTLDAVASAFASEVAGAGIGVMPGVLNKSSLESNVHTEMDNRLHSSLDEGSPVRLATLQPISVHHPHAVFQSVNLYSTDPTSNMGSYVCNVIDSSPLSAADFVSGRDQLVTASWDRLGRTYDLATGQELEALTGHDHQLTDVRCALGGAPVVVTSSRDCTFRLWDFRQGGMSVHVQQAHSQVVSTTQFLTVGSPERLISAGADHFCRVWDLRQSRGPLYSIRTDAGVNRLAISGSDMNVHTVLNEHLEMGNVLAPPSVGAALGDNASHCNNASLGTMQSSTTLTNTTHIPTISVMPTVPPVWPTSYTKLIALPLNNRGIKIFALSGNRVGRLTRSAHGHSRMVTSVAWADEGVCNFFSTGFDCRLLAWQIHIANI